MGRRGATDFNLLNNENSHESRDISISMCCSKHQKYFEILGFKLQTSMMEGEGIFIWGLQEICDNNMNKEWKQCMRSSAPWKDHISEMAMAWRWKDSQEIFDIGITYECAFVKPTVHTRRDKSIGKRRCLKI